MGLTGAAVWGAGELPAVYQYIFKRVLLMIPTLLGAAVLVFFLLRMLPGDVCEVRLGVCAAEVLSPDWAVAEPSFRLALGNSGSMSF